MANWKLRINVANIWEKYPEEVDFEEFKSSLISKLNTYTEEVNEKFGKDEAIEYENLVDDINTTDDEDEFDWAWQNLYDWADENLVWITTF